MNFGCNEEQELLRSPARKFFENECGSDTVRRLMETPEGISPDLWTKLAEQGWLGLVSPEAYDGMGLGLVDLVVLMEEMGRGVVPGPYFSAVVLGGLAIAEAGSEAQKKEWLPKIGAGDRGVALAWMEPSAQLGPAGVTLTAVEKGGKYTLSGTKLFVHDAHTADALVVAARTRPGRSEEHTSELQSHLNIVCRLLLEKKKSSSSASRPRWARKAPTSARQRRTHWAFGASVITTETANRSMIRVNYAAA